jgi:hypothetical protein
MLIVNEPHKSWVDRVVDRISPEAPPPPFPSPPPVDQTAWERSVDSKKVNTLTVHDVGLIVFNETQSFSDSPDANETIGGAREKVAHAVMNGDLELGKTRPRTARPIEPSPTALKDPRAKSSYDSSMAAARRAYLDLEDPTQGAKNFKFLTNADRSSQSFDSSRRLPLKTQSGPFHNAFLKGDVKLPRVYVNTYKDK